MDECEDDQFRGYEDLTKGSEIIQIENSDYVTSNDSDNNQFYSALVAK